MTSKEYTTKIKELKHEIRMLKVENNELREAINNGEFTKDLERVTKDKEFDFHCVKLNITRDTFVQFARNTREFLIAQVELNDKLTEQEKSTTADFYREFFDDAIVSRDLTERLKS